MSINNLPITVEEAFHNLYCSGINYGNDSEQFLQLEELVLKEISKTKDKYGLREALRYRPFNSLKIEEAIHEKELSFIDSADYKNLSDFASRNSLC